MSKASLFLQFMIDHPGWHGNKELTDKFGWSFNQRKNEMNRRGVHFESRQCKDPAKLSKWEYQLVTPAHRIDVEKCCLKPEYMEAGRRGRDIMKATLHVTVREEGNGQFAMVF